MGDYPEGVPFSGGMVSRVGHSSITVTIDQYGHLLPALDEALTDGLDATYERAVADFSRTNRGLAPVADIAEAR